MHRFAVVCLWVLVFSLAAPPAGAAGKRSGALTAGPGQEAASPPQSRDAAEAQALSERAAEFFWAGNFDEALAAAKQALDLREKALGPEHPLVAASLTQIGNIHLLWQGRRFGALLPYKRALEIREKVLGPEAPETAASLANLARFYLHFAYYSQALPLAQRSLKVREKVLGPDAPETAASLNLLANLDNQTGLVDQALPLAQRSLKIREKALGPDDPAVAESLRTLAFICRQMGLADQALACAQRAVAINEKHQGPKLSAKEASPFGHQRAVRRLPEQPGPARQALGESLRILGLVYLDLKNFSQAEACLRRLQSPSGKQGLAQVYVATGRNEEALTLLASIATNPWFPPQFMASNDTLKGMAERGLGHREQAYAALLEAVKAIEELRARTPGERTGFFEGGVTTSYSQTYREMVGLLAQMAQKGETIPPALGSYEAEPLAAAFYYAEAIKARALLEAMTSKYAGVGAEVPADLAAREKSLRQRLEALEAKREEASLDFVTRHGSMFIRGDALDKFKLAMEAMMKEQQQFAEEVRRRAPRYAALHYPQPLKAKELPLKPGEILLEYSLGLKESYLFRVEPGGKTQLFRLALGQEALEKRLGALLAPFRQSVLRREDLNRFSVTEAAALYHELLAPALSGVAPGTRLIIVPDGVLGAFPFEALVVQAGPDWAKSVLVGDRWPVTYSQSAAILALNRHLEISKASQPLFALGDCIYEKDSLRYQAYKTGQGQAGQLRQAVTEKAMTMAATDNGWGRLEFPPLPQTRQTVTDLAALFQEKPQPPQVLLDVAATETRLRQVNLNQYRYLFFGTHGFLADKLAGVQEPTLVLTQVENKPPDDGLLTFSKVLQLKLDAEVVTLAACMTGVGQVMQGEGVLNFARAFQQAGARSVTVALWNIPVAESLKFYHTFYQGLKEGKPKIEALRAARQAVRAQEPHPYFWSGLILHGEG